MASSPRVLLVITDADWYEPTGYAAAWVRCLEAEGARVERWATLPPGGAGTDVDLVIGHVLVEEAAALAPTLLAVTALEAAGARLLNPVTSLLASADKLVTAEVWAAAGVPQPVTHDLAALERWPSPGDSMVLKPSLGDGARHIAGVASLERAHAVVDGWRADEAAGGERRGRAVLQEWVVEPRCVRLYATPWQTSLAYEKGREPGALVTSGTVYPRTYEPSPELAALARQMVATLGGGLMGVDVLVAADGRLLALEANAPFGFDVTDPEQGRWIARAALSAIPR